jgi:hypothetical protein
MAQQKYNILRSSPNSRLRSAMAIDNKTCRNTSYISLHAPSLKATPIGSEERRLQRRKTETESPLQAAFSLAVADAPLAHQVCKRRSDDIAGQCPSCAPAPRRTLTPPNSGSWPGARHRRTLVCSSSLSPTPAPPVAPYKSGLPRHHHAALQLQPRATRTPTQSH